MPSFGCELVSPGVAVLLQSASGGILPLRLGHAAGVGDELSQLSVAHRAPVDAERTYVHRAYKALAVGGETLFVIGSHVEAATRHVYKVVFMVMH